MSYSPRTLPSAHLGYRGTGNDPRLPDLKGTIFAPFGYESVTVVPSEVLRQMRTCDPGNNEDRRVLCDELRVLAYQELRRRNDDSVRSTLEKSREVSSAYTQRSGADGADRGRKLVPADERHEGGVDLGTVDLGDRVRPASVRTLSKGIGGNVPAGAKIR